MFLATEVNYRRGLKLVSFEIGCHATAETSLHYFVSAKSSLLSVGLLKVAGVGFSTVRLRCTRKGNT